MRAQIIDINALAGASPRNIRLYLRTHGWVDSSDQPNAWVLDSAAGAYEVIAPSSRQARDFPQRVAELLRTLSIAEDRSELDILRDLSTLGFDVQYIHSIHDGPPGTAPLRDAVAAFSAAHALLEAAAASLEEPRLVLPNRRSANTADFMKKVLAGPATEGSYVISTWVPVPPRLRPEEDSVLFDASSEPRERAATRQLNVALVAAREATDEALGSDVGLRAFVKREAAGISANLCEALVALSGEDETPFDVRFAWALDRPIADVSSVIHFDSDSIPVLGEAARELRAQIPEEDVRIRGNVIRLHREGQLGAGEVSISGVVSGDSQSRNRRVLVSLGEMEYEQAILAHQTYADVEVVGRLVQRGTRTYLADARGFTVLPELNQ